MKKRKYLIILLSILICLVHTFSWADIGSIRSEGANAPAVSPSSDPSSPNVDPGGGTEVSGPTVVTTVIHTYVSGNVFEDLRQYDEESGMYTTNLKRDLNEKGIKNIKVELIDGAGNPVASYVTGEDGDYKFEADQCGGGGSYRVRFTYGWLDENKAYTNSEIKDIIKYNGQDYKAQAVGTTRAKLLTSYEETIIKKQKGCSQIFLLLDCSSSMQEADENGQTRLDIEKESAKQLVNDLLGMNKNIYIGIIGFGETAVIRKQLSNNPDTIREAIDNLNNLQAGESYGSGTNIAGAVDKANESFVNQDIDNSNRTIILLSDGAPTIYDNIKIYNNDSDEAIINKCNQIAELTNQKMKQIKDQGVKFMTIIPKTNDEFEDGLVNKLLDGDIGACYKPDNMEAITEIIKNEFVTEIERSQQESTIWNNGSDFANDDNQQRRDEVNNKYKPIDYGKARDFDYILKYDGSDRVGVQNFSNMTYMFVETKPYDLSAGATGSYYDEATDTIYETVDEPYVNQNLILSEREPSELEIDMKVTGMRITLSDGNILEEKIDPIKSDKDVGTGGLQDVQGIANVGTELVKTIDTELMQGAKIEIEYTMIVKNNSQYAFTEFELIDYAPNGLIMNPDAKLLSDDYTNKDYGWYNIGATELSLYGDKIAQDKLNTMTNAVYPVAKINRDKEAIRDDESLGNNGERYVKVVLQAMMNAGSDNFNYENEAEIFSYNNTEGRRMGKIEEDVVTKIAKCNYVTPADGKEVEPGFDMSKQSKIIIIPPTGVWHAKTYLLIPIIAVGIIIIQSIRRRNIGIEKKR